MKVLHVVGTRPNFMKIAPTLAALRSEPGVDQRLVHTGQHYDRALSEAFFDDLEIPYPDAFLGVGSGSHARQTALVMTRLERVIAETWPDVVLVVGDTNSTAASALCAAKLNIPVIHLEAGLRSGDRTMPEEVNRIVTDHVADLLLTPSRDADTNLSREGVAPERVVFVGNTMIDSLRRYEARARQLEVARRDYNAENYVLVTLHRPGLVDDAARLVEVMEVLETVAADWPVLFPVHPRTRGVLRSMRWSPTRVRLLEPQSYLRFLSLQTDASAVLTDSGGVQEETTVLGVPCFTLRTTTERPVTVLEGTNRVLGLGRDALDAFRRALSGSLPRRPVTPEGWDGRAAHRVADAVLDRYGTALPLVAEAVG